ncbi:hypothetical protein [Polaribacter septentrionalilitoris]|uniref:hypothetical protein n=1 Tax=Polaribacter septentrionalilitoris TaxID=2494657 RepID=UPI001357990C|nr:hypothetical protein [Polaribacter septentrionalilitoris]
MHDNFLVNFVLKGFTSILIGVYFLIGSYFLKTILDGFLIDDHPAGMLSVEIIEFLGIAMAFLVFLFSSLALFFRGKRHAKRFQHKLWNGKTKTAFYTYVIGIIIIFASTLVLLNLGLVDYLTPTFLLLYGVLLFILKQKERKNLIILSGLCLFLAIVCFLIPTYWYSSFTILGVAHVTYGVVVK